MCLALKTSSSAIALCVLLTLSSGCSTSAPITHIDRQMMTSKAVAVAPSSQPNTVVTTTPLCSRGQLLLPAGATLSFSYPSPYPYSKWRPVYQMRLPGMSTWWPATAVLSKSGVAYFSYFAIPKKALERFRRSCSKASPPCCPASTSQPSSDHGKNPVPSQR